jgi:hypothetical protein
MKADARIRTIASLLAGAALILPCGGALIAQETPAASQRAPQSLEDAFRQPPASARPRVWWHWMNGNVTKEGIRKDLEWMERIGIGGVQNFDAALQTPQVVDRRLVYMTPEWKDAFRYAVTLADQKGLEFAVAASPGWSETGGPWVPPEDGMKKLVWSAQIVAGGKMLRAPLTLPPGATGPFQDAPHIGNFAATATGKPDPVFYKDVAVLAYPLSADDETLPAPALSTASGPFTNPGTVVDGSYKTGQEVPIGTAGRPGQVVADFGAPRELRSISLAIGGSGEIFRGAPAKAVFERETGDGAWEKIADIPMEGSLQTTVSFAPVAARRFRISFTPLPPRSMSALGSVPGAVTALFPQEQPKALTILELRFSNNETVDRFELKAGFGIAPNYYNLVTTAPASASGIALNKIVDLSAKLRADGSLDWTPPPGRWKVIRFGYSLVGTTNHPATAEATGLEVDKFDGAAVDRYLDHYIGMLKDAAGPDMVGKRGIRAILTDSIEVGASNWTPELVAQFEKLRGYDPRPWLPALTGVVIATRAQTDKFLFDFRTTLSDLMSSEHYRRVAQTAHANDLKVYGEALEAGRPTLGNELAMRRNTDIPMAALWTYDPAKGPRGDLLGDMKGAASVAHVDGQNLVAAESLTAAFSPWAFAPIDLKPVIDLEFAYGINRPVIHTSVHQPVDDRQPGLSLGPFGQYFNRHESWAEMARPWVDYLSRSAFLLQQGRYFADVAYFYGEDAPLTVLYADGPPKDAPRHYGFDFVDQQMLMDRVKVVDGDLVADSGARFRILYLGGTSARMTLPTLRRVAELADAGATIVGKPPTSSPSRADEASTYQSLVSRLWGGQPVTKVGLGQVISAESIEDALASINVRPDVAASEAAELLFLHRKLADGDIYFLTNRKADALKTAVRFRVTGKVPELWHAETGEREPVSYRIEGGETVVPLELQGRDAVFVIFRKAATQPSLQVAQRAWRPLGTIDGAWDVKFQEGRGAPMTATLPTLRSLSESDIPGIRYFSGTTIYSRTFSLPKGIKPGIPLMLDLGKVGDVAEVYVNGEAAGTVWKPPYRADISRLVRPGSNKIEVRVANLWVNRLIGDAQPGAQKIGFTTMPTYLPDAPLRPAGLIGPVSLLIQNPSD